MSTHEEARLSAAGMLRLRKVDRDRVRAWRERADEADKRGDSDRAAALRNMADKIETNYRQKSPMSTHEQARLADRLSDQIKPLLAGKPAEVQGAVIALPDPLGLGFNVEPVRKCGPCQLCCKLLPIAEFQKPANTRCTHQRFGKGCAVYGRPGRPDSCASWSCRWLLGLDTVELRRPDLSRYVVDQVPDFVELVNRDTGERTPIEVVQVWCDPKVREAWKDDALAAFLERRAAEGKGAIIRVSSSEAITVFPPPLSERFGAPPGAWIVNESGAVRPERGAQERFDGVTRARQAVQP